MTFSTRASRWPRYVTLAILLPIAICYTSVRASTHDKWFALSEVKSSANAVILGMVSNSDVRLWLAEDERGTLIEYCSFEITNAQQLWVASDGEPSNWQEFWVLCDDYAPTNGTEVLIAATGYRGGMTYGPIHAGSHPEDYEPSTVVGAVSHPMFLWTRTDASSPWTLALDSFRTVHATLLDGVPGVANREEPDIAGQVESTVVDDLATWLAESQEP